VVFAAPQLVYHYVAAHQYRPPAGFVEAVIARAFLGEPPVEPTLLPAGNPIPLPPAEDLSIRSRFATLLLSRLAQPGERLDELVSLVRVALVPASWSDSGRPGLILRLTLGGSGTETDYEPWSESLGEQDEALKHLVDGVARERLVLWRDAGRDPITGKSISHESEMPLK